MADKTGISWTTATWNPATGCDRVSSGCDHCYALTMAGRLKLMGSAKYQADGDPRTSGPGFGVAVHRDALDQPLRWKRSRRIFVNSMSDLFHEAVPTAFIAAVFDVMRQCPHHTFQVLTKRHARMRSLSRTAAFGENWPMSNVWLGVSAEDQHWANIRIPTLLDTRASVRFVSAEPLLGPIDLRWCGGVDALERDWTGGPGGGSGAPHPLLNWVIAGGESGDGHRPMEPAWLELIAGQCASAEVPLWVKQDSGPRSGMQGRIPDDIWKLKQFPAADVAVTA